LNLFNHAFCADSKTNEKKIKKMKGKKLNLFLNLNKIKKNKKFKKGIKIDIFLSIKKVKSILFGCLYVK